MTAMAKLRSAVRSHRADARSSVLTAVQDRAFRGVAGDSRAIRSTLEYVRTLATQKTFNVLLVGDPGTGKELFARALHNAGPNAHLPFMAVDCASGPIAEIEPELFGYEVGAHEGATKRKVGLLELAGRGTVLIENIERLPVRLQPKLMHALAKRTARRVGGRDAFKVEATIIASTARPLESLVAQGVFREDLFFELNAPRVALPRLAERDGDVIILAQRFLDEAAREQGLRPMSLTVDAKSALLAYDWPGNVRELRTVARRAAESCEGPLVFSNHLRIEGYTPRPAPRLRPLAGAADPLPQPKSLRQIERDAIAEALRRVDGDVAKAAQGLDIPREELVAKMAALDLPQDPA